MSNDNDDGSKQAMLMEMGFEAGQAKEALTVSNGSVERAAEYLLTGGSSSGAGGSGGVDPPASSSSSSSPSSGIAGVVISGPTQDVTATTSQYSFDQGRSACTCIALTFAQTFLMQPETNSLTPQFLQEAMQLGVETYQQLLLQNNQQSSSSSVEHMSAEEILGVGQSSSSSSSSSSATYFGNLKLLPGGIRQGILSKDNSNQEMGIKAMLTSCHQDAAPLNKWVAVLITKTPETILVCLPPKSGQSNNSNSASYIVIDSHPRPGVVNSNGGAYARILISLEDVVAHLGAILPATELGPDIPEMMVMMYNSFDLYPLILNS